MAPLFMVRIGTVWKIDVPTYIRDLGDQVQASIIYVNKTSVLYTGFVNSVAAGKYQSFQDLSSDFKKASDALDAAQ